MKTSYQSRGRLIVLTTAFFSLSGLLGYSQQSKGDYRNVIIIVGDDHRASTIGAYGNPIVHTPNLDRMASRGTLFEQAFPSSPLCSPSRQSLLTGKYPHATGVSLLRSSFPEEQVTLADHLTPRGFRTAIIGKNHFNNTLNHGFELKIDRTSYEARLKHHPPERLPDSIRTRPQWRPFVDPAHIWLNAEGLPSDVADKDQAGTYFANAAARFIQDHKSERFFLWVGFEEPHSPFNFPVEFAGRYEPAQFTWPEGSPEDDEWVPQIFQGLTDEQKRGIIASYYTSVEFLDKNVGLILDALDSTGLADQTLVVYLGDNGYLLGDHKRFEKHTMWEEAIRVPLIFQTGNRYPEGQRTEELTEFVDLAPTVVEALGQPPLQGVHGKSLLPVLAQTDHPHRDFVFSEYLEDNKAMIRTDRWKYVFATGQADLALGYTTGNPPPGIRHFLYDLQQDPFERKNVADVPENAGIVRNLQSKLISVFEETHPLGKLPADLSIDERLSRYTQAPELEDTPKP